MKRYITLLSLVVLGYTGYTQNHYVPLNGLMAYYMLDGNAADSSGQANDGVATSSPATMNRMGQAGKASYFNGSSSQMVVPSSGALQPSDAVSVAVWIKPDSIQSAGAIVTKRFSLTADPYHSYALLYNPNNNRWNFGASNGTAGTLKRAQTKNSVTWGTWVFLTGTYDGSMMKFYINGQLDTSIAFTGSLGYGAVSLYIGYSGVGPEYYKGSMDELTIYNRALSSGEVLSMFNGTVGIKEMPSKHNVDLYPNPVNNEIIIDHEGFEIQDITISDLTGRTITSMPFTKVISLNNLKQGVYMMCLTDTEGHTMLKKFVKE